MRDEPPTGAAEGKAARKNPPARSTARIVDVARRADVSPATVSRVVNGTRVVNAAQHARVLKAIDELAYRPNLLARNLRKQKAGMIGVLVSDIENPHFTTMVRVVEDAAYRLGYRVLLCNTDETAEKQSSYLEMLAAERVLGVILAPLDPAGREIGLLLDLGIPIVAFDRPIDDPRVDTVSVDNVAAGRLAARHLLDAGHTRIGFVGDERATTCVARRAGYESALRAAGLPVHSADGGSRVEGGAAATTQLIAAHAPTGLVIGNNLMVLGALRALRDARLHVPEHVSVVGIDDPPWAGIVEPPLTVLAQPVRAMAESVIELLRERIETGRTETRRLVVSCTLVERASVRRTTDAFLTTTPQARAHGSGMMHEANGDA